MYIQEKIPADGMNPSEYDFLRSIGVDYVSIDRLPTDTVLGDEDEWLAYFHRMQAEVQAHDLVLYSAFIGSKDCIWMGGEDQAGEIDRWCRIIRAMGRAGICWCGWNFKYENQRTESALGRGRSKYSTFVMDELDENNERRIHPGMASVAVDEETMWANMKLLLSTVIPVAETAGVRLALHPEDPPVLDPLGGVAHITSTLDQYERIFKLTGHASRSNCMLFCQGCVTEMSAASRGGSVFDAIRRMASQDKIGWVHFRNISGTERNFREVFIDEGQVDMLKAMETYKECGFSGPFMMDHTPNVTGAVGKEGMAYAIGYIRALLHVVWRDELCRSVDCPPEWRQTTTNASPAKL